MKCRGLRATFIAGAIGFAVVAAVAFNWDVVRDHAEAWWFEMTTRTESLLPDPSKKGMAAKNASPWPPRLECLQFIADYSGVPVIFDAENSDLEEVSTWAKRGLSCATAEASLNVLRDGNWRIIRQSFPRAAYVAIGLPNYAQEAWPE
jgi:hypothetical protein